MSDPRGEQRVVDLLAVPLESYDVVTVSMLDSKPRWLLCCTSLLAVPLESCGVVTVSVLSPRP